MARESAERRFEIRPATAGDLPRIFAIYNVEVLEGTATFDTDPKDPVRDASWLTGRDLDRHPVLVATADGELLGWASLSPWSVRGAYARTAEVSVYVDPPARRAGTARALLEQLIEAAATAGLGVLLARIAGDNPGSSTLFKSLGFELIGVQRRCGEKFRRILDVELLDLQLDEEGRHDRSLVGSR